MAGANTDILLGRLTDIPPGEGRNFDVGGETIAVFHTQDGEVFATQPECPHRQGPLADGLVGNGTVVCPLHDRVYDLRTGCGLSHEKPTIRTYPVTLSATGEIWLAGGAVERRDTMPA